MLEIEGLRFAYGKKPVLKDVGFELDEGRVLGIIGPNGSGKSTLLKCIDRILVPRKGTIRLHGQDISEMDMLQIAREIGYVPQMAHRSFPATVFDTVLLGRLPHIQWRPRKKDLMKTIEIIEALDMADIALDLVTELSGGQRQKVMIGRALTQEPKLLLLDEPTANLDLKHQFEVMSIVKRLTRDQDISAIIAIHDLALAARFCDEFVILKDGRTYAKGDRKVINSENVQEVYDVRVSILEKEGNIIVVPEDPAEDVST